MSDVLIPYFDRQLHGNYHSTDYFCHNFRIIPGQTNVEFLDFLRVSHWTDYTFITAWNPFSATQLPFVENQERHATLLAAVTSLGLTFLPAQARDQAGHWPAEPGIFLFNLPLSEALQLGSTFLQNAILRGTVHSPPEILWTHGNFRK